jgi:hypothetical protein
MQLRQSDVGPFSPRHRLRRLDRRTRAGKFLIETERALVEHLGGDARVSVTKRILVERIAADLLRLEMLDDKAVAGTMTDHDSRIAHALRNSVRLALREIGLDAVASPSTIPTTLSPGRGIADILRDEGRS